MYRYRNVDRKELARRIEQHKQAVRKRYRLAARIACAACFVLFFTFAFTSYLDKSSVLANFHQTCAQLRVGQPLEDLQELVAERKLAFDSDPDPAGFRKEGEVFMIRPSAQWPARLGCKFAANRGEIVEVKK